MVFWEIDYIIIVEFLERIVIDGGVMFLIFKKFEDKGFLMVNKDEIDKCVKCVQFIKMGKEKKIIVEKVLV